METTNKNVIWGWGIVAAVLAFVILRFPMSYGFGGALILAILIGILVAILIWVGFYRGEEDDMLTGAPGTSPGTATSEAEAMQAAAPEPQAEAEEPAPAPQPEASPEPDALVATLQRIAGWE